MSDTAGPAQRQRPAAAEVIEDIHPLSPLQQGLLFHTLREADSAVYLSQTTALLSGVDPVYGCSLEGTWFDIGDFDSLSKAESFFQEQEQAACASDITVQKPCSHGSQ